MFTYLFSSGQLLPRPPVPAHIAGDKYIVFAIPVQIRARPARDISNTDAVRLKGGPQLACADFGGVAKAAAVRTGHALVVACL